MATPEKVPFVFRCSADLVEELDALAKENMLERTDLIIAAADNLLRFMERTCRTARTYGELDYIEDDFEADLYGLQACEPRPLSPDENVIPALDEGEDDGIAILKPRR